MSQCEAKVVEVSGDEVWVEVPGRAPACGSCKTADDCQSGLLGLGAGPRRYRVGNLIGCRIAVAARGRTVWANECRPRATTANYL